MICYRDNSVDILRGVAIFTMVAANTAAEILTEPHPFWLRLYDSFAAPLFILISGMMVAFTSQTKGHNLKYFIARGLIITAVGALIDVFIWNIYPFMSVDVLYLIGISLPLVYLFLRLNKCGQWIIIISIFLMTPILQNVFGYTDYPTEIKLSGEPEVIAENQTNILNHWLVDGWFPIFPWIGFSLLGVHFANLRWKNQSSVSFGKITVLLLIGTSILSFGIITWGLYPGKLLVREGYSELFYPPTIGYIITAIGLITILFFLVDRNPSFIIYKPLNTLGKSSLFIYILHLALIRYVIFPIWSEVNIQTFLLIYVVFSTVLILIAYGLKVLKNKWRERPFIFRVLLGG